MKFFDRIREALSKALENPGILILSPSGEINKPSYISTSDALEAFEGWVYAAINVVSNAMAKVRWFLIKDGAEVETHPVLSLLYKPNPITTRWELIKKTVQHLELCGNAFWYLALDVFGIPREIWLLDPSRVEIVPDDKGGIRGYLYNTGKEKIALDPAEIIHIKYPHPRNPYYGMGTLQAVIYEYNADLSMKIYQETLLKNRAIPDVVITGRMSDKQREALKEQWIAAYRGPDKTGKVAVLNFPDIDVKPLAQSLKDLEYIAGRKFTRDSILHIWGIPPSKVGIVEDVNRANAETADYTFQKEVIVPRLELIREILQYDLIEVFWKNEGLKIEYENPIPEDKEYRLKEKEILLRNYVLTINEVREELGYEPVDWGNAPLVPMNLMPLKGIENFTIKPATPEKDKMREVHWKLFVAQTAPWEKRFARKLKQLFRKQKLEVLENLERFKKCRGNVKSEDDIIELILFNPEEWNRIFSEESLPYFEQVFEGGIERASAILGIQVGFNIQSPRAQEWLRNKAQRFAEIVNETTWNELKESLIEGMQNGEEINALAERIQHIFQIADVNRSHTIARTEVIGASNAGSFMTFQTSDVVEKKEWLTARDEKVRPTHQAADGQVVGINEPFNIGGSALMFPGDPSGPPGEIINCRCTILPVLKEGL